LPFAAAELATIWRVAPAVVDTLAVFRVIFWFDFVTLADAIVCPLEETRRTVMFWAPFIVAVTWNDLPAAFTAARTGVTPRMLTAAHADITIDTERRDRTPTVASL
jgi:hypothetical protein